LGLHIREEGMTYADLLGYVQKVYAYNQTAPSPVSAFLDYNLASGSARLFYNLVFSAFAEKGLDGVSEPEIDAVVERVLNLFRELGAYKPLSPRFEAYSPSEAMRALMDGEALFFFDATWRYNVFEQFDPVGLKKLRLAQMPTLGGQSPVLGGYISTWAVLKNAPGREAGIKLLQHWSRPCIADAWVRKTKNPTGLIGSLYDPVYGNDVVAAYQQRLKSKYQQGMMDPLMRMSLPHNSGLVIDPEWFALSKKLLYGPSFSRDAPADK